MVAGILFLMFFVYTWLVIDPRLIQHNFGILTPSMAFNFSTGWPFFQEHLSRPGGLVEYAARWLSLWFCFGWVGALMITAIAWCLAVCTDVLSRAAGRSRGVAARYVPAMLLVVTWAGYGHPLRTALSLLAVLACFTLYVPLAQKSAAKAMAVVIVVSAAVCLLVGVGGLLLPVLVAVYESLVGRRRLVAVTAVLCGLGGLWAMDTGLFGGGIDGAYWRFVASDPGVPVWGHPCVLALYLFFPALLAATALLARSPARRGQGTKARKKRLRQADPSRARKSLNYLGQDRPRRAIQTVTVLLAAGAVGWFSRDARTKVVLLADYYSQRAMWPEVLDAVDGAPRGMCDVRCNRNIMLALYHTGRLGDEMFRYPLVWGEDPCAAPAEEWNAHSFFQFSRLYLELGQVNRAERCACEAFETMGNLPALLEHLAIINIVKDRSETARMFLTVLGKNPLHRRTARKMLQQLAEDPRLESDRRIREIRRSAIRADSVAPQSIEDILLSLLGSNPRNKMAFEFLMVHYLCAGHPSKVVEHLEQVAGFDYPRLPGHFQEAILIHSIVTRGQLSPPEGPLDPEIVNRAAEFANLVGRHGSNADAARAAAVAAGFGDMYFFYFGFGESGAVRQ